MRLTKGRVEAIERALEGEAALDKVMHPIVGMRVANADLTAQVIEAHVREPPTNRLVGHGHDAAGVPVEDVVLPRFRLAAVTRPAPPARAAPVEEVRPDGSRQAFAPLPQGDQFGSVRDILEP